MSIANINYVKNVLGDLWAKKKFGQNFLIDANIVDKIARGACNKDCLCIEIGPGLGALSEMLLKYAKEVVAYEIDGDMFNILNNTLIDERFRVILADFMDVDLSIYEGVPLYICSNLPYYVTTPILFKLFNSKLNIQKITVMVQREVADRFGAVVNSEDYNALTLIVQYLFEVNLEMNVSKNVFYPAPGVDSAVVSFVPKIERDFDYEERLFDFFGKCFAKRRKTLRNNLKEFLADEKIDRLYKEMNFSDNVRSQELTLEQFLKMFGVLYED